MKKQNTSIRTFLGIILFILALLYACSKDFEDIVQDDFDFRITAEHAEEHFVFEPTRTSFFLEPEKEITTVDYYLTYSHLRGRGVYLTAEGDTLRTQDTIALATKNWTYRYVALDTGAHDIKFKLWDSNERIQELTLSSKAKYASFSFLASKGSNEYLINARNPINLTLLRDKDTENPKNSEAFTISYQVRDGSGTLSLDDETYAAGTPIELPKGISEMTYLPTTLGTHILSMTATAPDGAQRTQELTLEVTQLEFSIEATASAAQVQLDSNLGIRINLTNQETIANVTYEIAHSFAADSEGAGTVRNQNGGVLTPGGYASILPGSYNYTFTSTELGHRKIYFEVRDSNGQAKRDSVTLAVANIPFSFTGDAERNSVYLGEPTAINFQLRSNGNTEQISYEIAYEFEAGDGSLTDANGTVLQNTTSYPITLGNFSYSYIPESIGSHQLNFLVTDNYGQEVGPVIIDFEAKPYDFDLTMTPTRTTEFVNSEVPVIIDIKEIPQGTDLAYEAFYTSDKSGFLTLNGNAYSPGEKFPLVPDGNTLQYTGTETGSHTLVLSVTSGTNVTRTTNTAINFNQVNFLFTGNSEKPDISVGEMTNINFTISEAMGTSNFTLRYSLSGNALLRDSNGNTINSGTNYPVSQGSFSWTMEGTNPGQVNLTFYATNDTGLEKSVTVPIEVTPKDYNFTASATPTEAFTDDTVAVDFNLSELGVGGDTYTMYFSNGSNNGQFVYEGTTYAAGQSFPIPVGAFQANYTGISEANHNLEFTVRSSSGIAKTGSVSIDFIKYVEDFDLTVSQPAVDIYPDNPFPFSIVTNAPMGHQPEVTYSLSFSFSDVNAGYIFYNDQVYREGEPIPMDYGSIRMDFTPLTDEPFTIDFQVENSTGVSRQASETVRVLRKPKVAAKGEKRNINCGGLNGCDYEVLLYTCFETNCSEAYDGASLQQVEIRIYNRQDNRWDTFLYNYDDARGEGFNRFFKLEEEPSEGRLKYLDQEYEIRVMDTNGIWSETFRGLIIRV